MEFTEMNEIILERLEIVKEEDVENQLGVKEMDIWEDFSINRLFQRGSTTHARNWNLFQDMINANNRWRKIDRAKGRKAKLDMIEEYSDIVLLIPTLVRYSSALWEIASIIWEWQLEDGSSQQCKIGRDGGLKCMFWCKHRIPKTSRIFAFWTPREIQS